jgi:hypothetical protein
VLDAISAERLLKPAGGTAQSPILRAEAADDRAGAGEIRFDVLRDRPVVRRDLTSGGRDLDLGHFG